ncbi:MAG: M20/M25/M40 family metallo-hydrolase, partial [Thermoanaerobaculia bacterium]|nr:M20/M25/M40 family metallo-hydrolase [Thermoanaerobaculia bacterium]
LGLQLAAGLAAPAPSDAAAGALEKHVAHLASEELEGRLTGTAGAQAAADYLAAELKELAVRPLPGHDDLRLPFEFTAGTNDAGTSLELRADDAEQAWTGADTVQALSFSDNGSVTAPVVFAGYGLVVPDGQELSYDSYATLDVEGKIALVLRYFPEEMDQESRSVLARYSSLRRKAMQAREHGAVALLVVTGPASPNAGETVPMAFDTAISGSGIVAASISGAVAERLFERVEGKTLATAQSELDDGNPHITGFEIPGIELTLETVVERERRTGHNVAGMLPGGEAGSVDKPWVVLGAHYDHLGRGDSPNSLAREEEKGGIHYGADDNASGVAAVLEAAAWLAERELRRNVVIAFWSGEELGLLGATAFLEEKVVDPAQVAAYLNLDMVGRMADDKLTVQAVGSSSAWPAVVEQVNVPLGLDLQIVADPYLPTDSTAFNSAEVPTLNLFTGGHEDYHRPTDTAEKINYAGVARIARFGALLTRKVASMEPPPEFVKAEPPTEQQGSRDAVRAFTGTIPDYTTEVEGLRLSGVIGGGPAEEAGLQEGDVIVEFG